MYRSEGLKSNADKILTIVWKDIKSEIRTKEIATSLVAFALLVIIVISFALEPGENTSSIAAGILWIAFTFAGVLGLSRSFVLEKDKGCLQGLMLCPVDRSLLYLGKMLSILIFMLVVEAIILPVFIVLFNQHSFPPQLLVIVPLATIGFAAVGTLFSAMAVNTRARDVMMPLLFLPIAAPVIIAAIKSTGLVLSGESWGAIASWLGVMAAFDAIFLAVSPLVFEFVIEE
jgi:heme exporter protein B